MKTRKFIDSAVLSAKAGNGGNGSASFRREKFVAKGGPDGGDGGRGGHITLKADRETDSLIGIFFSPVRKAEHGGPGRRQQMHGKNGGDLVIKVPRGTLVMEAESGEVLADIVNEGEEFCIAHGGKGGRGNVHWKSSTHQAPTEQTNGEPGEEVSLKLELKLVADIGLVGFPNAGKSSLLTKISDAHPRVAAYPFTTLNPIIGTIIFENYTRATVADIPGLIKDAHLGVGLGYSFLRHIERAHYIIYVIDMAGTDGREPEEDYRNLREELKLYRGDLMRRPSLVVSNKMDCPESAEKLATFIQETGETPLQISAETGEGIDELRDAIFGMLNT
ncbi:MAG: GTPase ObgE [Kiritimatiellia bacterium]|nr:GTPase ObgE [Planctomycetota bacterium]MDP6630038.1 GTPase ObgE [Kiritimatiellia bacterium]